MKISRMEFTECAQTSASPVSLAEIGPGRRVKLVAVQAGNRLQARLAALGLLPGSVVEMVRNGGHGPCIVAVGNSRVVLGRGMASQIKVS